ncbi:MAG: M1 family aminopeptidase [Calditrichia bacterium]
MLGKLIGFEWRFYSRQLLFFIAAILYVLLGIAGTKGNFGGLDVHINSPFVVTYFLTLLSLKSIFPVTIFCASGVLRDKSYLMEEIVYTTSISKFGYLFSRFIGLFLASWAILVCAAVGMLIGSAMADQSQIGPIQLWNYLYPLIIFCIPNVLFACGICFTIALLTRSVAATYVGGVLVYALYFVGSILGNSPLMARSTATGPENELFPILIDPFGLVAFFDQARYWTTFQKNTQFLPLEGDFLVNRLFWLGCITALFLLTYTIFSFRVLSRSREKNTDLGSGVLVKQAYRPWNVQISGFAYYVQTLFLAAKSETKSIFKSVPFLVLMALWILLLGIDTSESLFRGMMGTRSYPTTGQIVSFILDPLRMFGVLLIIFYAGEQFWRERSANFSEIMYVTPMSNITILLSKWLSLVCMIFSFIGVGILVGICIQIASGYIHFELEKYARLFYYGGGPLLLIAAFALIVQLAVGRKYPAMLITGIFFFLIYTPRDFGFEHPLLRFAMMPPVSFSDMNGFGHYADSFHWRMLYWAGISVLLILGGHLIWRRGTENGISKRLNFSPALPGHISGILVGLVTFSILVGGYILYQTNYKNSYQTIMEQLAFRADYEKKYCEYKWLSHPIIVGVKTTVDLFPEEMRYSVKGHLLVENKHDDPINTILIGVDPEVSNVHLEISGSELLEEDQRFKNFRYRLDPVLLPGERREIHFSTEVLRNSFVAFNSEHSVQKNGSYIEMEKYLPFFGFSDKIQLSKPAQRLAVGLSRDPKACSRAESQEYQWIDFESTISTTVGQTVVSVGNLVNNWTKEGRSYFHYKSSQPIPYMFAFSSAFYEKMERRYKDVSLQLYYHLGHEYNVKRLLDSGVSSLSVFENSFSPYQYDVLRYAQIPHYIGAATAYPSTLFATTDFGFLLDVRDSTKMDYVSMLSAHEVSHQWWAGQLEPVYEPGYKFLTEGLAQYSEILVLKRQRKDGFLREFAVNELDFYTMNRGFVSEERALKDVEARTDAYVYYNKGAIVLMALDDLLGEEIVNGVLQDLLEEHRIPSRKATIADFLQKLYAIAPPERLATVKEWLEEVTSYDLKVENVVVTELEDQRFRVEVAVDAGKRSWDKGGKPTNRDLDEELQIGLFREHPDRDGTENNVLLLEKHRFRSGKTVVELIVDERPSVVGIDPMHLRVDLNRYNNFSSVE